MKNDQTNKRNTENQDSRSGNAAHDIRKSEKVSNERENNPRQDRSAKTSRKGAGQQQDSGSSPINS